MYPRAQAHQDAVHGTSCVVSCYGTEIAWEEL